MVKYTKKKDYYTIRTKIYFANRECIQGSDHVCGFLFLTLFFSIFHYVKKWIGGKKFHSILRKHSTLEQA